ncbi:protein of unknown function (plasmid) [Cupriavidus taiwanensis]|uniref:Uncharacterized protein n=1 Tax=Cupriavidus taiwanensis TaxID=164546 RepID=A0A9Q7V0Z0_9BURK|nr:protein of unknown function [Cupriavidus taiwanensis]
MLVRSSAGPAYRLRSSGRIGRSRRLCRSNRISRPHRAHLFFLTQLLEQVTVYNVRSHAELETLTNLHRKAETFRSGHWE